ncbi:hypothetical protein PHYBOEH_004312 [Phytophthora boehmeriae]|uniref:Uncharacterized protein n=1 Tax=Phytophthora boehmeriae TaxID=109152 RepID=A0A8T1X910_9STRA|nr:hypothetical protein PHYBOEH_004312 [Phytophthora boehmeriae]
MMAMMEAADSDSVFTSSASIKTPLWPGRAYSSALSKSVRAMMAPRRVLSSKQVSESDSVADAAQFADAVARKDKEKMLDALAKNPSILRQSDANGWLPLHQVCYLRPNHRFIDLMTMMVSTYPDAVHCGDKNVKITRDLLRLALQMHASSVCALAKNDLSPLHFLCTNEMCSVDLLTEFFSFDSDNSSCGILDKFGATALHLLCMNESISTDIMRTMLLMCPEDSFIQDVAETRADPVDYYPSVHEMFDGAKRRVALREVDSKFRLLLQRTLVLNPSYRWGIDRLMCISDQSSPPIFSISEASSASFIGSRLTQNESDTSIDVDGGPRIAKHAQEQLEFMRKEQSHLRHSLLAAKLQLRKCDQKRANLQLHVEGLRAQVVSEAQQRKEAQLEAQLLARNHQSMTHQLHTTVQVLLNLVPLARKVYGVAADDFLSFALSQTTENGSPPAFPTSPSNAGREEGPVQLLKTQLQNSVLAHGCIQKWANSTTSSAMARAEIESSGVDEEIPGGDNVRKPPIFSTTTSSSSEVEDTDSSAAAVA